MEKESSWSRRLLVKLVKDVHNKKLMNSLFKTEHWI